MPAACGGWAASEHYPVPRGIAAVHTRRRSGEACRGELNMKTRILSSLVGLALLAVVFAFLEGPLLNIVIGIICVMAVYELLSATGCLRFRGLVVLSLLMALLIPFARVNHLRDYLFEAIYFLILAFFILLIINSATMSIQHFAMAFLFSTVIPVFYSCAVYLRDDYGPLLGGYYLLLALGSGWLCDSGAYFIGRKWGKRKLAPRISPNKTVEGAVGGLLTCTVLMLLISWGFDRAAGGAVRVNYAAIALYTPVIAVIGMLGDLSASVIKRGCGIKDFGNVMPGHGGILDRFDSVLFTLPAIYILTDYVGLVTIS